MARVFLSVGSNLGIGRRCCARPWSVSGACPRWNSWTPPRVLDGAVGAETGRELAEPGDVVLQLRGGHRDHPGAALLLERMQALERAMGRTRAPGRLEDQRYEPRPSTSTSSSTTTA